MAVYMNGSPVNPPVIDGGPGNAIYNGRVLWVSADRIASVTILSEDGKPAPTSLPINGSVKLAIQATYGDGHKDPVTTENVTFQTSTPDLVNVNGNTVAWRKGGTAVVTATYGGVTSEPLSITCASKAESITVSLDGTPLSGIRVGVGDARIYDVDILPEDADQSFTVTLSDKSLAETTIAEKMVTITAPPSPVRVGSDVTMSATASDGATGIPLNWSSSDPKVAAFTKTGAQPMHKILTPLTPGSTVVSVSRDGYEGDSLTITVKEAKA